MSSSNRRPRIAVISPFLDKRHGGERAIVEWLEHLPGEFEIHVYAQDIQDMDRSKVLWHRISKLPGPHLFNYLWWLVAVRLCITWDRRFRGLRHDLVFSSGVNYSGADVICVHVVFAAYIPQVAPEMRLLRNPIAHWPRLIHRRLYYRLVSRAEAQYYSNPRTTLVAVSRKTADELIRFYDRHVKIPVVYYGVDHVTFSPEKRAILRKSARSELNLYEDRFALLLVGNDWRNKGVPVLLEALARLRESAICLFVVSREDPSPCLALVKRMGLENQVRFLPPRDDIEFYYAAADAYVGPSLQDAYALPPAEAMACGLPVIVSAAAGVSETISDGFDGLVLKDPRDATALAGLIRRLYEDDAFRTQLGERAVTAARRNTWERGGQELAAIFNCALQQKSEYSAEALTQNP